MRIILTADLHYNIPRSKAPTEAIAARINRAGGDALVLVGDCAGIDLSILERSFALFESFPGRRFFVAGNHELWAPPDGDSMQRYADEIAAVCDRAGVHYLDRAPYVDGDVALVGNVGWYDYTFRQATLGVPLRFYQNKVSPGAALAREEFRALVDAYDDVSDDAAQITTRWMDGVHVRMAMSDVEFARAAAQRLREHLAAIPSRIREIVVALHHLPFVELVPTPINRHFAFASAFLGSELFGEVLLADPRIRRVYCGHSHHRQVCRKAHLTATAIGSTYMEKRYDTLDA
ncbi:MAG: metallophosphoesterase [Phycisphaerae bacterium]|nr:metallophosphoesterase [Phycisphaerae bacterium]